MSIDLAAPNQPVSTAVHAFVAPVQRESSQPTVFDASQAASFDVANPPSPWIGVGPVENFQRTAVDESMSVQSGTDATVVAQFRKKLEAHVAFSFRRWGKLQLAMGTGGTHWNVLAPRAGGQPGPAGGEAVIATPVFSGSTATALQIDPQFAAQLALGDLVAVDLDYLQQTGYVGVGFPGAYVAANGAPLQTDFIRRVTFNIGKVAAVAGGTVTLENPLPAGDPPNSAGLQKVVGFTDREGGAFRQEWSALFFEETVTGGRVCYYYPRLQSLPQGAAEKKSAILGDYQAMLLQAHLLALPATDPQDGVSALWYRTYIPSKP